MARVCQVSGKKAQFGRSIRHVHSGQWARRAPKTQKVFLPNLQIVTIQTPGRKVRLKVSTKVMKSPEFQKYLSGEKPLPKELLKR